MGYQVQVFALDAVLIGMAQVPLGVTMYAILILPSTLDRRRRAVDRTPPAGQHVPSNGTPRPQDPDP